MTSSLLTNGTFFFPGPTEVRPEVMQQMTKREAPASERHCNAAVNLASRSSLSPARKESVLSGKVGSEYIKTIGASCSHSPMPYS